ncbi:MAG: GntR family transcriptional regulator [Burkholderiales bacterium]
MAAAAAATIVELPPRGARLTALAERAYRHIKSMVLDNRVRGGEYLLEEDLVRAVGVSRTPVREALVQLQNEGLIDIVPRRGIRIVPLTVEDIREIHDIMQWLESQAAHALAMRPDRAPYVKALRRDVTEMRRALARGDLDTWARINDRFHMGLVVSSGNTRLVRICENLLEQTHRVRMFTLRLRKPPTRTTGAHSSMLKAIEAGDGDKAVALQVANKKAWLAELTEIVERLGLRHL